jgi:nucleotide-binding universal stress UspA family protein
MKAKKILLATDGSVASLRAAEHVGAIVSGCPGFEITLYHVCGVPPVLLEHGGSEDPAREEEIEEALQRDYETWFEAKRERCRKEIFEPAIQVLKLQGVDESVASIQKKVDPDAHPDVAWAIINEARNGDYGVVALGRRGLSPLKEFIMGSVSFKVVHHLRGCAVWMVE